MNVNEQDFMNIIKAYIHEYKPEISDSPDWDSILKIAAVNSLSGVVGYMILKYRLTGNEKILENATEKMANSAGFNLRRYEQAKRLLEVLNENHISHTVVKGYQVREYYPEPRLRTFGDIDILIHKNDRNTADQLMRGLGYRAEKTWEPVYTYRKDTEFYEMHTQLMDAEVSDRFGYIEYFDHAWDHTVQKDRYTYELTDEFHLQYLMAHLAKHINGSGAGVRLYLDLAVFIDKNRNRIDWTLFNENIRQIKLEKFTDYLYQALDQWLDIDVPEYTPVSSEIMDDMLKTTICGGTFGFKNSNFGTKRLRGYSRSSEGISKTGAVMAMIFPSIDDMKSRYTYLESKPWLLPAAWIHRLIINRHKIGDERRRAGEVLKADETEVQKMKEISRSIGL